MQGLRLSACAAALSMLLLAAAPAAAAAEAPALVTLLQGEATLITGARAHAAAVGVRLAAGTLVETGAQTTLLRLEWPDGSLLDLGPATQVLLKPAAMTLRKPPQFYLLQGWAKQTQAATAAGQLGLAAEIAPFKGVLVSQVGGGSTMLFSESGAMQVQPRRGGAPLPLPAGGAVSLGAGAPAQALARPPAAWLQSVPRAFRETIPPRAASITGPEPTLQPRPPLSFAALLPWLSAEPALRRELVPRLAERLDDPAFREAATAQLTQQPEWEPWLRPPRPPPPARTTRPSPNGNNNTNNTTTTPQEAPR